MFELPPPEDDGLCAPEVGEWSRDKHHFLRRYLDAFTESMKGKQWSSLHYIDLFAGAGLERLRDSGELEWGSPLIAAQVPHPFARLHLCELNREKYEALSQRLTRFSLPHPPQVLFGDANIRVGEVVAAIPQGSLSVAFLDPYGLHCHFSTLKALAEKRVDLIVFFPDHLDAMRNWKFYEAQPNSNMDQVLGPGVDWLSNVLKAPKSKWAERLRGLYEKQIRTLGYSEFEYERISAKRHPLYRLIFCSRDKAATRIWRGISKKKPDGQYSINFD
jgi:three-Cys-motif partner protein